jgi:hypothetical protein
VLDHPVATDLDVEPVGLPGERGGDLTGPGRDLRLVAGDGGEDQGLVAVGAAQRLGPTGPVRRHIGDAVLGGQPLRERRACLGGLIDRPVRIHQEDEIGRRLPERVLQRVGRLGGFGARIGEAAALHPVEQPRRSGRAEHRHQHGDHRDPPAMVEYQFRQLRPHVVLPLASMDRCLP